MPVTLLSVKLSLMVDSGKTSTRPSLPKLTTALEPLAVVTVLSEKTVAPEMAFVPFTETSPTTDSAPEGACAGAARATIENVLKMATVRLSEIAIRLQFLLIIILLPSRLNQCFVESAPRVSKRLLQETDFNISSLNPPQLQLRPCSIS